jgi:hypothetical protein
VNTAVGERAIPVFLHDGNELQKGATILFHEIVHLHGMITVRTVYGGQDIELYLVALKDLQPLHHALKGASPFLIDAIGIVEIQGTIEAEPHQELVFVEKLAPFVIKQDTVGLDGIGDLLSLRPDLILQGDCLAEELDAHEGRFTALPTEADLGQCGGLCGNVLPDHFLQNLRWHFERGGLRI